MKVDLDENSLHLTIQRLNEKLPMIVNLAQTCTYVHWCPTLSKCYHFFLSTCLFKEHLVDFTRASNADYNQHCKSEGQVRSRVTFTLHLYNTLIHRHIHGTVLLLPCAHILVTVTQLASRFSGEVKPSDAGPCLYIPVHIK